MHTVTDRVKWEVSRRRYLVSVLLFACVCTSIIIYIHMLFEHSLVPNGFHTASQRKKEDQMGPSQTRPCRQWGTAGREKRRAEVRLNWPRYRPGWGAGRAPRARGAAGRGAGGRARRGGGGAD